jgi:hypothetical protein
MHQKYNKPLQNLLGVNIDNEFSHGKIYKIEPVNCIDTDDIYIGSTTTTLEIRMYRHLHYYANNTGGIRSTKIFDKYGVENCQISLIENFPCLSRKELFTREAFFINSLSCVNKNMKNENRQEDYSCAICNYSTTSNSNLTKHCLSGKHIMNMQPKQLFDPSKKYQCKFCFKIYNSQPGLWKHNLKCKKVEIENEKLEVDLCETDKLFKLEIGQIVTDRIDKLENRMSDKFERLDNRMSDKFEKLENRMFERLENMFNEFKRINM